ncbi:MAG: hypothetical protein QXS27_02140 [Candidatus Jordarchaeaceae archaeon]
MLEIVLLLAAFAFAGHWLVSKGVSSRFMGVLEQRRWGVAAAILVVSLIVAWLGLRFLYLHAYWWMAWTMGIVLRLGLLNTTLFTALYLTAPSFMGHVLAYYIWVFYGIFTFSVIPFFYFVIFTSLPYTVISLIVLSLRFREDGPAWTHLLPVKWVGGVLGFIQFIAIIVLLATNPWAQIFLGLTFILWAWIELLIVIFLPLALTLYLPVAIVANVRIPKE